MITEQRRHAAATVARRNAADNDYAELLAVDTKVLDLLDYIDRSAKRLNNTEAADQLRQFGSYLRDLKHDELDSAFAPIANDLRAVSPRLAEAG